MTYFYLQFRLGQRILLKANLFAESNITNTIEFASYKYYVMLILVQHMPEDLATQLKSESIHQ